MEVGTKTVFIAGSIKIKKLDPDFVRRIENIVDSDHNIIIGDANGADTSVQKEVFQQNAKNVLIYCTGDKPRNNFGDWGVKTIMSKEPKGTRAYFTAKDREMASDADFGLMLWDSASTGTLTNVFELIKQEKMCVVFVNKLKRFINVKSAQDIPALISVMSEGARSAAESKINLSRLLFQLNNQQIGMDL